MGTVKIMYPQANLSLLEIKREIKELKESGCKVLEVKRASEWMEEAKLKPVPLPLIDCLWYQGELAILFADTNLGKSILAVQIADALTKQKSIMPFQECERSYSVLYCDFEMSDKQFENRYSANYSDHYQFSEVIYRAELNLDEFLLKPEVPIEEQIGNEIENYIIEHQVEVVIIDNLTYIAREIEQSKNIQPIMQKLKWINKRYGTSILVLAHTPKRDMSRPLTSSDIAGSKFLSNFADSIIAIGKSSYDEMFRYVKQIKSRNSAFIYGEDNVVIYSIEKNHNFLGFNYQRTDREINHLTVKSKEDMNEIDQLILEEHARNPEASLGKIAEKLGTNKMRVKRILDRNA
jgi:RecA-family ATPase